MLTGIEGSLQTIEIQTRDERWAHDPAGKGDADGWFARDEKGKAGDGETAKGAI